MATNNIIKYFMNGVSFNIKDLLKSLGFDHGVDYFSIAVTHDIFTHEGVYYVPHFSDETVSLYKPTYNEEEDLDYLKNVLGIDIYEMLPYNSKKYQDSASFMTHFGEVILFSEYDRLENDRIKYLEDNLL